MSRAAAALCLLVVQRYVQSGVMDLGHHAVGSQVHASLRAMLDFMIFYEMLTLQY